MTDPLKNLAKSKILNIGGKLILMGDHTPQDVPLQPTRPRWLDGWEPRTVDVEFFRQMLSLMKDDSVWVVPATKAEYRVDKTRKKLVLVKGKVDEWFWKNAKTLPKLGYTVIVYKTASDGSGKTAIQHRAMSSE